MQKQLTRKPKPGKPVKPHPDFPLFPHASGRWAKKVRGKFRYFGKVANDPKGEAAISQWLDQKDALLAGRTPRAESDGLTVRDLANRFLTAKQHRLDAGEIAARTFSDYRATCERIINAFGRDRLVEDLNCTDFESYRAAMAKLWGPVPLSNEIQRVRSLFKFGFDNALVDMPIRFGSEFKKPNAKSLREARHRNGILMFEALHLRKLLKAAGTQLRAMILLGVNCGFGNNDCGTLPIRALDVKNGWVNYPRPKTGIERRAPLWPETIKALRAVMAERPTPKDEAHTGLVFITKYGTSWAKITCDNPVSKEFTKLLKGQNMHREGLGFYSLRRTFETVAGESRDQVAVDHVMGHAPQSNDMASVYRQRISDSRLQAVANDVRDWLFGTKDNQKDHRATAREAKRTR